MFSDVIKQGNKRIFIQKAGPGPANVLNYTGVDAQYLSFSGANRQVRGGVDPVNNYDPLSPGEWIHVGTKSSPPNLPKGALEMREKVGTMPFAFSDLRCPLNIYIVNAECKDPSAFDGSWEAYMEIWGNGQAIDVDLGARTSFDGDDVLLDTINYVFRRAYAIGPMQIAEQAAATILREIVDVVVAPWTICGNCGSSNDGFKWMYALHKENTGVTAAGIAYSVDGGATWTLQAITGMANTEVPTAIEIVGDKLVVLSPAGQAATQSSYYITTINRTTGVPGATWTEVNTGFVVAGEARDMFVLNEREVFFVGDGGYIYKSSDITAGVTVVSAGSATTVDLLRVAGKGEVLMAAGTTGKVLVSNNRGISWSLTTTDPSANSITAVAVRDAFQLWAGDSAGGVYYSLDQGVTWVAKVLAGVTLAGVFDIVWATPEVGYIAATIAGPLGRIFATSNGGATWMNGALPNPRLLNVPSAAWQRPNRIALPSVGLSTRANNILVGGLGLTTDGILMTGRANEL